ncbi:DEAD/DEAH box helicase [Methanobacterium formicicum]|uniref:EIF-4a family ATP-dependent RNA helicase n=1 Tax=Methanobacterium formicicum (strain DSM 3637 / PP1) TaxID=1204725 RepID=K2RE05_METFP|nr:DEAD/DEAH box helicase [Methanobacterium formicicum]EKF86579.1 EIF-4a family ATP-dependent RNA helicase [Methanobacterium formicicum DSM 3637]
MLKNVLDTLEGNRIFRRKVEHIETLNPRKAEYGEVEDLPESIQKYLKDSQIRLYKHQVRATELIRNGENILITTPTASGKTLAFNLPIMETMARDEEATALYIYPAKALANDQLNVLKHLESSCNLKINPNIYDGDTPRNIRPWIKENSRLILTNPYMLHLIMGWNHQWTRFYKNLKYVVIDEAHHYRGVFGSNVAFLIRRLRRICNHYGSYPQFILSSATLANPDEFSRNLVGTSFQEINEDTSPSGKKHFILYNPYARWGDLSTHQETSNLFQLMVLNDLQTLCFTISRKMAELIAMWAKRELNQHNPQLVNRITAYRSGYLASERRKIENGLKTGNLVGVTCTNALELGMDIGSLDGVIISGYPGTMISTWQQAGRAGRGENESMVVMVAFENALDQYLMKHPEFLFHKSHENAVIDLHNKKITNGHLLCATKELPLTVDEFEKYFDADFDALEDLRQQGLLKETGVGLVYTGRQEPAMNISLDQISSDNFKVFHDQHLMETMDRQHAYSEAHEGAVLINQGETYTVDSFNLAKRTINVKKMDVDYHTQALKNVDVSIVKELNTREIGNFRVSFGEVKVTQDFYKYKAMIYGKTLSTHNLDLPPLKYHTRGLWFTIPGVVADSLENIFTKKDAFAGSLHGAEHALISMFPLLVLCDRFDIGGLSTNYHPETGKATIFIYDAYEGGIGLAEKAVEVMEKLVEVTRDMVKSCQCRKGCPTCIYSPKCGNDNKPLHKNGTIFLLEAILKMMKGETVDLSNEPGFELIPKSSGSFKSPAMGSEGYQEFENPENLNRKGESFYLNGNLNEAARCFQKVLEMDENNISALKYQGIILAKQEKPEKALEFFEKVLLIQSDDPETLYYQAVLFNETEQYAESKNISMKLLKARPDWDDAWSVLAIALHALGDREKAIEAYSKALELDPLNHDAAINLKDLLDS